MALTLNLYSEAACFQEITKTTIITGTLIFFSAQEKRVLDVILTRELYSQSRELFQSDPQHHLIFSLRKECVHRLFFQ